MRCDELERRVDAYLAGELSPADTRLYEDHLAICPECYARLFAPDESDLLALRETDWYAEPPPQGFATSTSRRAVFRRWQRYAPLAAVWVAYTSTVMWAMAWLAMGNSILGLRLPQLLGFARSTRSVFITLTQAFSFLQLNDRAIFMLLTATSALFFITVLIGKEVYLWLEKQ